MIDMNVFAEAIEEQLNASMAILDTDTVIYRFRVYVDGGEYRDFDYLNPNGSISVEQTNKIVRYINCEFDTTGSRSEGVLSVEMSFTARLQVMIPLISAGRGKKRLELVTKIRQIMDETFRLNSTNSYEVDGTTYTYGVLYQLADTGDREKRAEIGDSIILTAFLSYFLVENGINSSTFELYIDNDRVPFTRLGFNRGATNESVIPSDSNNGAGKNICTSTVFGFNFDMPLRNDSVGRKINDFLFKGNKEAHTVKLQSVFSTNETDSAYFYTMLFDNASINAETTKFASVTVSMIEALV